MNDVINSIKVFLYERVSNPMVTSFTIAWCIWNYRFFVIFLSGESIKSKFYEFELLYSKPSTFLSFTVDYLPSAYTTGLIYPLLTALFYVVITPFFYKPIIEFHYNKATQILNAKNNAEGKRLLTEKESRDLVYRHILKEEEFDNYKEDSRLKIKAFESQIEEIVTSFESQISTLTKELEKIKNENASLEQENKSLSQQIESTDESFISSNEWQPHDPLREEPDLLKLFERILVDVGTQTKLFRKAILESLARTPKTKILVERAIDLLLEAAYLSKYTASGGEFYEIQPSGREYIVKHKLMNDLDHGKDK